jgi:hypothetical protein
MSRYQRLVGKMAENLELSETTHNFLAELPQRVKTGLAWVGGATVAVNAHAAYDTRRKNYILKVTGHDL